MKNKIKIEELRDALNNEPEIIRNEIINSTSIKLIGTKVTDLYFFTNKTFLEKIICKNSLSFKNFILDNFEIEVRNIYVNNKLIDFTELKELKGKKTISVIDTKNLKDERTSEISGENDIVEKIFFYEKNIENKKKIRLNFYNKFLSKEYEWDVKTSLLKGFKNSFRRNKLKKKIRHLLELKYVPINNNTKEFIKLLDL